MSEMETPYTFVYEGKADHVALVGSFNHWSVDRDLFQHQGGTLWTITKELPPGRYEYKFVINGEKWEKDPNAPEWDEDGHSVITVGNAANDVLDMKKFTANAPFVMHNRGVAYNL